MLNVMLATKTSICFTKNTLNVSASVLHIHATDIINPFFQGKLKEDSKKLINVLLIKKTPLKNNFLLPRNICWQSYYIFLSYKIDFDDQQIINKKESYAQMWPSQKLSLQVSFLTYLSHHFSQETRSVYANHGPNLITYTNQLLYTIRNHS